MLNSKAPLDGSKVIEVMVLILGRREGRQTLDLIACVYACIVKPVVVLLEVGQMLLHIIVTTERPLP